MNRIIFSLVLALSLLAFFVPHSGAAPVPEPPLKTQTELDGDWRPISIRNGTDELPAERLKQFKFTFRGNRHILTITTETVDEVGAGLRVDPKTKEIDLDLDDKGPHERQPLILGIYKLEGDTLAIAYSRKNPKERLKAFPTKPESGVEVVTLTRIAAQKQK